MRETENKICKSCKKEQSPSWPYKLCHDCFEKWKAEKIARGEWTDTPRK